MTRLYTAYLRTTGGTAFYDEGDLRLVKDGFSWPAFLLAVPWALWHRMWIIAAALVVVQVVLGILPGLAGFGEMAQAALSIGLALAIGFAGSDLRDGSLRARGYTAVDVVLAESRDMAERRFLENRPQLATDMAAAVRGQESISL